MKNCRQPELGKLLHAYELGMLSDDDRTRFEAHLLDCEACFGEITQLEGVSSLLRDDVDVAALIRREAAPTASKPLLARWRESLWPQKNLLLRPAMLYLLLVLAIYPAYRGLKAPDTSFIESVQTLNLTGMRSLTSEKIVPNKSLAVRFRYVGSEVGHAYVVALTTEQGETLFIDSFFTGFDETETAQLLIPAKLLTVGRYDLTITDPTGIEHNSEQTYTFTIE
jgi:anti-sigma factor RsiW